MAEEQRMDLVSRLAAAVVILAAIYVASYLVLVRRCEFSMNVSGGRGRLKAAYVVGSVQATAVFYPLHRVDLRLREDYWHVGFPEILRRLEAAMGPGPFAGP